MASICTKLNNHIEDWTHSSSGHVLSWESDDSDDNKYIQIYDLISYEPEKFKNAHDTLVKEFSKDMGVVLLDSEHIKLEVIKVQRIGLQLVIKLEGSDKNYGA